MLKIYTLGLGSSQVHLNQEFYTYYIRRQNLKKVSIMVIPTVTHIRELEFDTEQ